MIVDTNIFIDYLRESEEAKAFLTENHNLLTSVIVLAEIISGFSQKKQIAQFEKFIHSISCRVIQINETISSTAIEIYKQNYFGKGIGFEDCLIAATALEKETPIVSLNIKHFRFIEGLDVVKPY